MTLKNEYSQNLPKGFRGAGVSAGLKSSGAKDLALIVNDGPDYFASAVFTTWACIMLIVVHVVIMNIEQPNGLA